MQLKVSKDTSHLRSVTLPRKNVPNGVFGTILGWGKEGDNLGFSETLKKSVFQMIDREHCSAEAPSEYLFENKFCAKEIEGFGTCGVSFVQLYLWCVLDLLLHMNILLFLG